MIVRCVVVVGSSMMDVWYVCIVVVVVRYGLEKGRIIFIPIGRNLDGTTMIVDG